MEETKTVRGFSVATRCKTVEEFIASFHARSDEKSIVVNVIEPRVVGTECAFAILLADRTPVLAGICSVLDVFTDTKNVFKRRGMRLGIKCLGVTSERVFLELAAHRLANTRAETALRFRALQPRLTDELPIMTADVDIGDAVVIAAGVTHAIPAPAPPGVVAADILDAPTQPLKFQYRPDRH